MTDIKKILDSVKMEGNIPAYNILNYARYM